MSETTNFSTHAHINTSRIEVFDETENNIWEDSYEQDKTKAQHEEFEGVKGYLDYYK